MKHRSDILRTYKTEGMPTVVSYNFRKGKVMPAWTACNGDNWADELDYVLWNSTHCCWEHVSLDEAQGKVITMTEVRPHNVNSTIYKCTIYIKNIEDL